MFRIAIIGCGNMGLSYARSFLRFNLVTKENLLLVAKSEEHAKKLSELNLGKVVPKIDERVADYGVLVLAVKPQDFSSIAPALSKILRPDHVLLSVMAGITIASLQAQLHHDAIVRAMPNTPTQLGMGVTAFIATEVVNLHRISVIDSLLSTTGRTILLGEESQLDAVTALSGSGPAYFFHIIEIMIRAGVAMGLDESVSAMLVKQTMQGSFHLLNQSSESLEELVAAVSSKGGTTEAAFQRLEEGEFARTLSEAILAAHERAKQLSMSP
jgi:pyrroline-5-carboxylate reductase